MIAILNVAFFDVLKMCDRVLLQVMHYVTRAVRENAVVCQNDVLHFHSPFVSLVLSAFLSLTLLLVNSTEFCHAFFVSRVVFTLALWTAWLHFCIRSLSISCCIIIIVIIILVIIIPAVYMCWLPTVFLQTVLNAIKLNQPQNPHPFLFWTFVLFGGKDDSWTEMSI